MVTVERLPDAARKLPGAHAGQEAPDQLGQTSRARETGSSSMQSVRWSPYIDSIELQPRMQRSSRSRKHLQDWKCLIRRPTVGIVAPYRTSEDGEDWSARIPSDKGRLHVSEPPPRLLPTCRSVTQKHSRRLCSSRLSIQRSKTEQVAARLKSKVSQRRPSFLRGLGESEASAPVHVCLRAEGGESKSLCGFLEILSEFRWSLPRSVSREFQPLRLYENSRTAESKFQYLLTACEPYETIAFKAPSARDSRQVSRA